MAMRRTRTRNGTNGRGRRSEVQGFQAKRAYDELKRQILENELPAGWSALEQELAERLAMSRTPVREAMMRLSHEGLVEVRPRHGMRVLPVSAEDMREIYEVLTGLESTAAELAATRGASDVELSALEGAVEDMAAALKRDDLKAWAKADDRFHMLLVSLSGNRKLRDVAESFLDRSRRVRILTLKIRPKPTTSNRDHAAVVDAIRRRDAKAAHDIHRAHRVKAGKMLIALLYEHGLTHL